MVIFDFRAHDTSLSNPLRSLKTLRIGLLGDIRGIDLFLGIPIWSVRICSFYVSCCSTYSPHFQIEIYDGSNIRWFRVRDASTECTVELSPCPMNGSNGKAGCKFRRASFIHLITSHYKYIFIYMCVSIDVENLTVILKIFALIGEVVI